MIRRAARHLLYHALNSDVSLARLRRALRRHGVVVLMYHELWGDSEEIDAWTVMRRSAFLRQIEYLRRHYDVLTLDEAAARLVAPARRARPGVVITFDDGHQGLVDVLLPMVESEHLPVTIYLASGHIERQCHMWFDRVINALQVAEPLEIDLGPLYGAGSFHFSGVPGQATWLEIDRLLEVAKSFSIERCEDLAREVERQAAYAARRAGAHLVPLRPDGVAALANSRWIEIGGHSHCHGLFPLLSPAKRRESLQRNRELLREWTGREIRHFAYPSGEHDAASVCAVAESGFATAVTTVPGIWTAATPVHRIPRVGVGRYDDMSVFRIAATGGIGITRRLLLSGPSARI